MGGSSHCPIYATLTLVVTVRKVRQFNEERQMTPRVWFIIVVALFSVSIAHAGSIQNELADHAAEVGADGFVSVIINLTHQASIAQLDQDLKISEATRQARHYAVVTSLKEAAASSQAPVIAFLAEGKAAGRVTGYTSYWISNLIIAEISVSFLDQLAARSDINVIEKNFAAALVTPVAEYEWLGDLGLAGESTRYEPGEIGVTPGLRAINADRCWNELGLTGNGRLICGMDTGVDCTHPALMTRWRGFNGAYPIEECWLDVVADTVGLPYDNNDHGTHTMGTMTGMDPAAGDTVGVAWNAQWIACNAIAQPGWNEEFDNDVIACFQWIADPDGDPQTIIDVPDVCQNSWGTNENSPEGSWYTRCDDLWWEALDNLEAAGVVAIFSAGNSGPLPMTCGIPADRASSPWNVFSIGALDATNYPFPYPIADFSSRGPSSCDEVTIKPEISAPGVDVVSCVPDTSMYTPMSGTSMAGPHVAGVVALMREIDPDLEVDRIKQILIDTAIDHGVPGEDNIFGHGNLDAYAACLAVINGYGDMVGQINDGRQQLPGVRISVPEMKRDTFTDSAGSYQLQHLPAGTFMVVADLFGYYPDTSFVTIDELEAIHDVALTSMPRGCIRGVVSCDNSPIVEAVVDLLDAPVEVGLTSADGEFFVADLPVRSYAISVGRFGWLPLVAEFQVAEDETTVLALETLVGISDDFEIDQGWIIGDPTDTAYDGIWERSDPNPTYKYDSTLVQPADDHTPYGSLCYLTHNQPAGSARAYGDVDGGKTSLVSPVFDATSAVSPVLTFARWFHNQTGYPRTGDFRVEVSNDGGDSWVVVQSIDFGEGGWEVQSLSLTFHGILITDQMQLKFVAEDLAAHSATVEAAVDDVQMTGFLSDAIDHEPVFALHLAAPTPNPLRKSSLLSFSIPRQQEINLAIYDTAGRLVRRLMSGEQTAGSYRLNWDGETDSGVRTHSGVYFVRLVTEGRQLNRKIVVTR